MTGTINANETLNGGVEAIPTLSGTLSGNTTSSYNSLSDKPIINGTTLEGGVDRSLVEDVKVNGVSVVTDHVAEIENSAEGISYDNTSSTGVQATNVQDALDEAFQRTMDIGTWFTDVVAENYNYIKHYTVGDYVFHYPSSGVIKLYRCIENTSGFWDISKWEEVKLSNEVSDEVTLREELESATKVYGTPKNLPQPIATFTDGANLPMPSLKVSIEPIQSGSGDPSPSNVRPISGWDEVNVSVEGGQNLYNDSIVWKNGYFINASGVETQLSNYKYIQTYIEVEPSTTYSLQADIIAETDLAITVPYYTEAQSFISRDLISSVETGQRTYKADFTTPSNCKYIRISVPTNTTNIVIYEKYVYTIDLDGTRYGGTLDVVSGVLTVTHMTSIYDGSDDEGWALDSNSNRFFIINDEVKTGSGRVPVISNIGKYSETDSDVGTIFAFYASQHMLIYYYPPSNITSVSDYKTWLSTNNLQVRYELATPQTYQLTPTQVKSLLGSNNVWGDCGQIKDLKYVRNLNITINDLISRVEALEG